MRHDARARDSGRRNRRVAALSALMAVGMLGLAFAAVPLYRLFCQVTGYGGTTQRAARSSDTVLDRTVRIRFDANVGGGLAWSFEPLVRTVDVKIGENTLAFYRATNRSTRPLSGSATFNVTPEVAGLYFNKIQCFCFTEQRLEAGESVEMPVSFFIDPEIMKDSDARRVREITLSYTFYPMEPQKSAAAPAEAATRGKGS
ncbi:MAG TPA: cytochrome c oxidase assembly protein [Hyphomicrobiaceae bacterium]|nr:cytochrome c oxidase assembly protein [Hyphomicrobiaceae bacterium]